jgi:putative aldouronate transport system substrate-binding protein
MSPRSFSRRSIIRTAGIAGAASLAPRITFAQDATPPASPVASPAASPAASPVADASGFYPSGVPGVPDAYTKVPAPFASTDGPPGTGGKITAMVMTYSAPPTPKGENQYWQELDKRLNVEWEPVLVPNSTYGEKATAIIASGDLPDLFYLNFNQTLSPLAEFIEQGAFLDLTPYVTGDNLQKYPNLATFPEFMWQATTQNGKIWGVPCPNSPVGQVPNYRTDWAQKILGRAPENAADILTLFTGMTSQDPDGNGQNDTWGFGKYGTSWDVSLVNPMFRVPNGWRVNPDGTFTHQIETEEYRMALDFCRQLWAGGAYHPDSPSMQFEQALQLFDSGRTGLLADGGGIWGKGGHLETIRQYQPEVAIDYLIPPGHDGQPGVTNNLPGIFGFTAISITNEGNEEKIDELLRIFNWFSGPFGSEEWLFKNNGIEGVHFEYDEIGTPIKNETWEKENGGITGYIGGNLLVNFVDTEPDKGPLITEAQKKVYELGVSNPAANLYSPTAIKNNQTLSQLIADTATSIVTGREDIPALDGLISDWQSRAGNDIRAEYEAAYVANQG